MLKWTATIVVLALGGFLAYGYYDYRMAGHDTRPEMPEGAFSLSYQNGLRGILVDLPDERKTRRYLGIPADVPFYLKESWSWCRAPTEEQLTEAAQFMAARDWPGQRLEAVCTITIDDKKVVRGLIVTVPNI